MTTRLKKRWGGRLRTGGALLMLIGAVALVDRALPGAREWTLGAGPQIALGAGAFAAGLAAFLVGRRWR